MILFKNANTIAFVDTKMTCRFRQRSRRKGRLKDGGRGLEGGGGEYSPWRRKKELNGGVTMCLIQQCLFTVSTLGSTIDGRSAVSFCQFFFFVPRVDGGGWCTQGFQGGNITDNHLLAWKLLHNLSSLFDRSNEDVQPDIHHMHIFSEYCKFNAPIRKVYINYFDDWLEIWY